jgi:superfamily I DNA and RNA helicase
MKRRKNLVRLDDEHRRSAVSIARTMIFKKGKKVNSKAVQSKLELRSSTATKVTVFRVYAVGVILIVL